MANIYTNIEQLVGKTPLFEFERNNKGLFK